MKKTAIFFVLVTIAFSWGCKNTSQKMSNEFIDQATNEEFIIKGKEIASYAFLSLSGELAKAAKHGGIKNALSYCNTNAIPLTDSLSNAHNVDIKRTSLKFRNPKNKPTEREREILNQYEMTKNNGLIMEAIIDNEAERRTFYAPIIMQTACIKCHGEKSSISMYDSILKLYPNDLATDYNQGDLRGMWSITFNK
ncbi:MAG: hypothetical protein ACJA1A_001846 [Saprospiraceae bacterium]|jgi:hypothetical protein|tara:strand:+ start:1361 stop:1945 length:585 start_codon:yes stop_codon:yes gene_type:complete